MTDLSEGELKQRLGIDSWRNLSKDKLLTFVSEMPNLSHETTLKIIDQFPDFRSLVLDSLGEMQEQASNALSANWKSQKKVHKAFSEYREILRRELDREDLTRDDRLAILKMLSEAVDKESAKDSEHKAFAYKLVTTVASVAAIGLGVGYAVLGGKVQIGDKSN